MAISYHRILILRGGALGDFVLSLPALAAVRRRWPAARIELAGNGRAAPLALAGGLVDAARSLDTADFARLFVPDADLPDEQRDDLRSRDLIICYLHDPDGVVTANLARAGGGRLLCVAPLVRDVHAAVHFLRPLRELGVETDETAPRLDLGSERRARGREWARGFGGDVLAIQPGSGSPAKNWPLAKFVALAGEAAGRLGLKPVFMLGEAEERIRDGLAADRRFPVAAGMSALELAERLSACAAYVGNDSGVTHLAVALGLPVVALFGPTDPRIWGPGGPNGRRTVRVIRAAAMTSAALAAVPIEGVLAELRGLVRP